MSNQNPEPTSTLKKPKHPSTEQMVDRALVSLNDSKGCSYQAIKKYISSSYQVDIKSLSSYVKKYITTAVESGKLIQISGRGVNGSFRLSAAAQRNPKKFVRTTTNNVVKKPKSVRVTLNIQQNNTRRKSLKGLSKKVNGLSKRAPKPRLAKTEKQNSLSSDGSNSSDDTPSTSVKALRKVVVRSK